MSIGFLLGSLDDAVIWRGPKKNGKASLVIVMTCVQGISDVILPNS